MRHSSARTLLCLFALVATGCEPSSSSTPCEPGNILLCQCADGAVGTAECSSSGLVLPCECDGTTTMPMADVVEDMAQDGSSTDVQTTDAQTTDAQTTDAQTTDQSTSSDQTTQSDSSAPDVPPTDLGPDASDGACAGLAELAPCGPPEEQGYCFGDVCAPVDCAGPECLPDGMHFPLPDTGQTSCFDTSLNEATCCREGGSTICDQDGDHGLDITDPGPRFSVEEPVAGEKIVVDRVTGVTWTRCPFGATGDLCDGGFVLPTNVTDARAECHDLSYAGFDDWRLPTIYEAVFSNDFGGSGYKDPAVFPLVGGSFWSGSYYAGAFNDQYVWSHSYRGNPTARERSENRAHYCVRGVPTAPMQDRFTNDSGGPLIDADDIFVDQLSGLRWSRDPESNFTRAQAHVYCDQLAVGGHSDWRLPTRHELLSLANYGMEDPEDLFAELFRVSVFELATSPISLKLRSSTMLADDIGRGTPIQVYFPRGQPALITTTTPSVVCVQETETTCGNGARETGEACDGTDVAGASCVDLDYPAGSFMCTNNCSEISDGCERCSVGSEGPCRDLGYDTCLGDGRCGTCTMDDECGPIYGCFMGRCVLN